MVVGVLELTLAVPAASLKEKRGVVKRIVPYGCFVEIFPGTEGLVHISELDDVLLYCGDTQQVRVKRVDSSGQIYLSPCWAAVRLFVDGLAWATDDENLQAAFASFGNVHDAKVIRDDESGRSRGFGFVTFDTQEEAAAAIGAMDGSKLDGRTIRVDEFAGRFGSQPSEPDRRPAAKGFFARLFGKD